MGVSHYHYEVVSLSGRGGGLRLRRPPLHRPPYRRRGPLSPGGSDPARVQMPGLMRQARQVEDELDSFQMAPSALRRDSEAAGSNAYGAPHAAPAHAGPD